MTTIILNRDAISRVCGNRGGVHKSIAYAGAEAIAKIIGEKLCVFSTDEGLYIAEWEYASGTYRAEPTRDLHRVRVIDSDADAAECIAADGDFAAICIAAMRKCLAEYAERTERRENVASTDPLDVGFDPNLHQTM